MSRRRTALALNAKLSNLKKGEHYMEDLTPAIGERTLFQKPTPEESNVEKSKEYLTHLALTYPTKRDAAIDYSNPRQELSKFPYGVDEVMPFDHGPLSYYNPAWDYARQQVNQVIQGRQSFIIEEGKYDVTLENQKEKAKAMQSKASAPRSLPRGDPPPTSDMQREIARRSFMETVSAL